MSKQDPFQTISTISSFFFKTASYFFFSSEISLKEIEHLTVLTPYSRAFQGDFLQHFPLVVLPCLSVSPEKGGIHENKAQRFPISFGTMSS